MRTGYRHIDTAAAYGNEREVGEGIRRSGVDRSEIFIETKIWISDYGYDATLHAFDKSAGKLGVDQIDLLILHQPLPSRFDLTIEAYRALETLLADGRVRAIGVSNFMPDHLERPAEEHDGRARGEPDRGAPVLHRSRTCSRRTPRTASCPRRGRRSAASPSTADGSGGSTLDDPTIAGIAEAHGKTPAQVMLRWHLQQGRSAIPKSTKPGADRRELRRVRLRADRRRAGRDRRARHRRAGRPRTVRDHPRILRAGDPGGLTVSTEVPGSRVRRFQCSVSVEGLDAGEAQFFDVEPGLEVAGDGVVDDAFVAEADEDFTFAVEDRQS